MTEFVVHSIPGSPFGRAVLAAPEGEQRPSFDTTEVAKLVDRLRAA